MVVWVVLTKLVGDWWKDAWKIAFQYDWMEQGDVSCSKFQPIKSKMNRIIILLLVVIATVYCQDCRYIAPRSDQCNYFVISGCIAGSIAWPYPMSTCQFPIHYKDGGDRVQISASSSPESWKITSHRGRLIKEGRRGLNVAIDHDGDGFIVHLTFPSSSPVTNTQLTWKSLDSIQLKWNFL